jgi:anti-sigma regulatory factor (Ser/Thr protein kinase)
MGEAARVQSEEDPMATAERGRPAGAERSGGSLRLLESARFRIRTLEEALALARSMAHWFPEPARVAKGLAELLCNAVEHGSLEIGFELKGTLLKQGDWRREIKRRQAIEPYASRSVEAVFARRKGGWCVVITDEGPGFDWKSHLVVNPTRAGELHGRGIAHARAASFDHIAYNKAGNRVLAFARGGKALSW